MFKNINSIFPIPVLIFFIFVNQFKLHPENKKNPIDFSKYEIIEPYYFDCPKKKECFKNCSNSGSALPYRKYDQFYSNDQVLRNECTRKCNEIICTEPNK